MDRAMLFPRPKTTLETDRKTPPNVSLQSFPRKAAPTSGVEALSRREVLRPAT
jgi:hypothetical protein